MVSLIFLEYIRVLSNKTNCKLYLGKKNKEDRSSVKMLAPNFISNKILLYTFAKFPISCIPIVITYSSS